MMTISNELINNTVCPLPNQKWLDRKKAKNVTHGWEKNQSIKTNPEIAEIMKLLFKTAITNIFK